MNLINYFETRTKSFSIIISTLLVIIIGLLDRLVPADISTAIFYLIPISIATWIGGKLPGIWLSLLSTILVFVDNEFAQISDSIYPAIVFWNSGVILSFFLIYVQLVSELNKALKREKKMARTDYTTGVANKQLFYELAELELKRSRRYGHPFTVGYIDLDNFKTVNDAGGHKVGDLLLQEVAKTITNNTRETDIVARMGGDEFALLLAGLGYEPAHTVISRVQTCLLETMQEHQWPVTFSIGAITFIDIPESVDDIIAKADYLMYCVKTSGKNRIEHRSEG